MSEKKYFVADKNGVLARGMSLDDALMFIKAYWAKGCYYCPMMDGIYDVDFYCADAERRTDD